MVQPIPTTSWNAARYFGISGIANPSHLARPVMTQKNTWPAYHNLEGVSVVGVCPMVLRPGERKRPFLTDAIPVCMLQELVFFRNTSTLDETLYTSPAGKLSIRQTMILGAGCGIVMLAAMNAYNADNDFMDAAYYLPFLAIPLVIGLYKPKILTMDELLYSVMLFLINGSSVRQIPKPKRTRGKARAVRNPSRRIGYYSLERQYVQKERIRVVTVSDLGKPTRLKLVIQKPDGGAFRNHFVSIYLDGVRVTAMTTDSAGEVEALVTPGTEGNHSLKVMAKGYDEPVIDGDIRFRRG